MESKNIRQRSARSWAGKQKASLVLPLALLTVFVVGAIGVYLLHKPTAPRSDRYQAVYVETGQVYFGKLKNTSGLYLRLEDAYVAQAQDTPPGVTEEQKSALNNNVSLARVADQVYGPENVLEIRADKVIFWQNLTSDSKVTKAIEDAE